MRFYKIKSQSSTLLEQGLFKHSLVCEEDPGIFLFLWLDEEDQLTHLQLLFDEQVLEWRRGQGYELYQTNRRSEGAHGLGYQKGSRNLVAFHNPKAKAQGLALLGESQFPQPFGALVQGTLET
ncbi:MAG: hypothetical protein A2600_11615 [Candidatus Lambdaproteobacteria bacterium RIFOXYD1_FULL_56_27]|uniref:Uncharacterized protein n=1 Tax=Candidatus Lambdaproteobacteria bacterium RIFOXYD2_FULL_56_26 TaxID=1817773 RepID=A0A1F6GYM4_9PROT|nr:MAG: hypothetical protein A2426_06245 [Candidatus Lambdaproteobacteria bacterium RIFOXYC1_FULL_56_13]OGH03245.1 MAG: hypothetical protein A2557_00790 [Candidatus Lambdaproteobacteria bacterium RIFOXYD2_FULL_56_26]OGH08182.1 MAG: hypothetical protein A2600_11615 [Candidatus Lambdaproteobacteria bacterium RIFOXYD1_FULL_56_27]